MTDQLSPEREHLVIIPCPPLERLDPLFCFSFALLPQHASVLNVTFFFAQKSFLFVTVLASNL